MKNSKTMCMIAKAIALEHPTITPVTGAAKQLIGYGLTIKDIRKIYAREGFNILTNKTLIDTHIKLWIEAGYVTRVQDVIYWNLDSGEHLDDAEAVKKLRSAGNDNTYLVGCDA